MRSVAALAFLLLSAPAQGAAPAPAAPRTRSRWLPYHLLSLPRAVLELPWAPVRRFLDYSERTDLFPRVMDWFYFDDEHRSGWFPNASSEGSSDGAGLSMFNHDLWRRGHRADAGFTYAGPREFLLEGAYSVRASTGRPYFFEFKTRQARDDDAEVFARAAPGGGVARGALTSTADSREYSLTRFDAKATAGRALSRTVVGAVFARTEAARAEAGRGSPAPAALHGLGERVGLAGGGARLTWDFRNEPVRPSYGCLVQVETEAVAAPGAAASGTRYGYSRYTLDAEHYLPVYDPHRVLVFRHSLRRADPLPGRRLPFYDAPVLDLNNLLRSYQRNRFQDQGSMLFNLEYRYPVWTSWDAFAFFDGGQSFAEYSGLRGPDFRFSQGFGVRAVSADDLLFSFHFGAGREGGRLQVSLGQVF